jgi:hypothetical protein
MLIWDFDKIHVEIKRNTLNNSCISTDTNFMPLCCYVRMTTGVEFPFQTCQREPPSISNKSLQSDENDLQPYITVLSPQLEREMKCIDHECSIFGIHSSQIQRSLNKTNVCHKYWRICNQFTSFYSMQVATVGIETKGLLNIMLVRYTIPGFQTNCGQDRNVQPFELRNGGFTFPRRLRRGGWCSVRGIFFRNWTTSNNKGFLAFR